MRVFFIFKFMMNAIRRAHQPIRSFSSIFIAHQFVAVRVIVTIFNLNCVKIPTESIQFHLPSLAMDRKIRYIFSAFVFPLGRL